MDPSKLASDREVETIYKGLRGVGKLKKIDIIIPTRNRYDKLMRCLDSMPKKSLDVTINIVIICDGDVETAKRLLGDERINRLMYVNSNQGSVYCRNLVTPTVDDALIYATDDIVFQLGAIEEAIKSMRRHFPDEDGVIGFHIENAKNYCISGVALVGQPFLRRYPEKKLFYPKYFHFSCQEIERLGEKLNKIHSEKKAKILHYHPAFYHSEIDKTHIESHKYRSSDKALSVKRRTEGLIWGDRDN